MGGIPAAHLGRLELVDFLFLDRTFRDLLSFPNEFSKYLPPVLQFLTMWENPDNSLNYMHTNCYKVISCDPNDQVIADSCSLKTGVSMHILNNEL
jgi:hypothetical protein